MTVYAKIENGAVVEYPLYEGDVRARFPETSFPATGFVAPDGFVVVKMSAAPQTDHTKNVVEATPVLSDGEWSQAWSVVDASEAEVTERAFTRAQQVRSERNRRLSETDWRFRSDMTPSQEWKDYCQALRDVTAQPGFPWDIQWPAKPE